MAVLPGIFFVYDLSPFMVNVKKERIPVMHLFTKLLAIVGGVFTVLGIVDSIVFKAQRVLNKKK
jgi:endoplasmic reticulum-Golgi intermediate compartment protein 3